MPKKTVLQKQTIQVRHNFSDEELIEHSRELCRTIGEISTLESEKSSSSKDYGSRIEIKESQRDSISNKVSSGYEMRDVDALVQMDDPKKGKKSFYRIGENGEKVAFIETRDMTHADLQMPLPEPEE